MPSSLNNSLPQPRLLFQANKKPLSLDNLKLLMLPETILFDQKKLNRKHLCLDLKETICS
jgi:hypothetical protein